MTDWQQGEWLVRGGMVGDDQPVVMVVSARTGDSVSLPLDQVRAIAGAILDAAATLAGTMVTPPMVCGVTYRERDCKKGGAR